MSKDANSSEINEEDFYRTNRKEGKILRKEASAKDRSKYKKTDQDKYLAGVRKDQESKLGKQELFEGRVLSIVPQGIIVDSTEGLISCILKGLLKREKTHFKNLVAVGDIVLFERNGPTEGVIAQVQPRKTILSRADNLSRNKEQLIAVNIDQVIITTSVVNPPLKPPLIDRYIIATQKGGMKPLVVINKIDLLDLSDSENKELIEREEEIYRELLNAYTVAQIPVISVSTTTGFGLDALKQEMKGKASVFSGQSGVGKSSLINVITGLDFRVGDTVDRTKKGCHTTTTTQLVPLELGGWCIDTPGIKSFGVWDLKKDEVKGYFSEIHECSMGCKFPDCSHTHEVNCAVKKAVLEGGISLLRYESYLALIGSVQEVHVKR